MKQLVIGAMLALAVTSPALSERLTAPGTSVSLDVPVGFAPAEQYAGFEDAATSSSILVTELPIEAWEQIAPVFGELETANAALAAQNVTVDSIETMTAGGHELLVLRGKQTVSGVTIDKWIALTKTTATLMLTGNVVDGSLDDAAVKAIFASLEVAPPLTLDQQLAALPYQITGELPFTETMTLMGNTIGLTTTKIDPTGTLPRVILAWQLGGGPVDDVEAVATTLIGQTNVEGPVTIEGKADAEFAGAAGIKHLGSYTAGDVPMRFVQDTAIIDQRFVRLMSTFKASESATVLPIVERIATTVSKK